MLLHAGGNREQKLVSIVSPQYPQKGSQKGGGENCLMLFFWLTCFRQRNRVTDLHRFLRVVRKPSCIWYCTQQLSNSIIMTITFKLKYIIREDKKLQEREGGIFV